MPISSVAAGTYAATQKLSPLLKVDDASPKPNFGALIRQSVDTLADQAVATDQAMGQALTGRSNLIDVVTAVAESETAVQTLVSVRDKVIAAYEDVMRMTI